MSTLFQDEILKIGSGRGDSRSSTPFTYDSDCSGSGVEQPPPRPPDPPDHRPYYIQITSMTADSLVEWQWPPHQGEWFLLQEQVKEYLQTRNFHRRYPDIHRHSLAAEERNHLVDTGLFTEPAFHFIAVKTDEVLDILKEDYPTKHRQVLSALRRRDALKQVKLVVKEADEADDDVTTERVSTELRDVLVEDAQSFNKRLCVRRGGKFTCSSSKIEYLPRNTQYIAPRTTTRRGRYPVALLPGQYTDNVPRYTSEEMYTLPINTVLLHNEIPPDTGANTGADTSTGTGANTATNTSVSATNTSVSATNTSVSAAVPVPVKPVVARCGQCVKELATTDRVIRCNTCRYQYHTLCISISDTMLKTVSKYSWDCPSCKRCSVCNASDGEENLMFCDVCDRGYHTFCVGVASLPHGRWECKLCVKCTCCGTTQPGDGNWRFQHNDSLKFIQTMCHPCTVYFDKGWFCPVCLKVFDYDAEDNPMVCCDFCDRWIHTVCDNIDDEHYTMLAEDGSRYKCVMCRGEKEEVYDKHHKKYSLTLGEDDSNKENNE